VAVNKSMEVLVVDDYPTMRRIIKNLLAELGFTNVSEASDGGEALKRIPASRPGLIVSDWNMEPMTGLQLLQAVRANKDIADIPFIMVTAESKTDNVIAAKNAGVNNYIVKPFNAETLRGKMSAVLGPLD
jgi:two-component system chemotaxis response regulator CheY